MDKPDHSSKRTQEKPKHRHDKAGPKSGVGQDTRGNEKVVNAMDKAEDMEQGFDYKDQHDTKHHKEKKVLGFAFLVCFWGIFCSYFVYGLLQERMYVLMLSLCTAQCITPPPLSIPFFPRVCSSKQGFDGERFHYFLFLVAIQCVVDVIVAWLGELAFRNLSSNQSPPSII